MKIAIALSAALITMSSSAWSDMWGGFIDGAIDGAIIGGILDGEEGAIDGSIIGGTIGAIDGAQREVDRERNQYYRYRRHDRYAPPKKQSRPESASALVVEIQLSLRRLGYDPGSADGIAGQATARAVQACKRDYNLPQDNRITGSLLDHMR